MYILAAGFDLSEKDREFMGKVIKGSGFGDWAITAVDVRTSAIDLDDVSLVVVFGERAARSIVPIAREKGLLFTVLASVKNLYSPSDGGNEKDRAEAFKQLCDLKGAMKSGRIQVLDDKKLLNSLKPENTPDLSIAVLQVLEKELVRLDRKNWMFITRDGKVVCLSLDPASEKKEGIDIVMSFAELIALRAAMDVFNVKEIQFLANS